MTNDTSIIKPLAGKVASVLNERELTINLGKTDGVEVGMKFRVLADAPLEVHDPETNELLGVVDREKVRVKASEVYERFSICRTYVVRVYGDKSLLRPTASMIAAMSAYLPREVPETLKAKDQTLIPPLSEEESYVKRGDRVAELLDEDESKAE